MWNKNLGVKEGISTCAGLVVVGLILHLFTDGVDWRLLAWPVNLWLSITYVGILILLYLLRTKLQFVRWAMSYKAAVPALVTVVLLTVVMGLSVQVADYANLSDVPALNRMLSSWPFVLAYVWMTSIVGLVSIKKLCHFRVGQIPSLLNHLGLFVALVAGVLGSADMERLTMNVRIGQPEWRAVDSHGRLYELPLAVELKNFSIDEYPPKLMLIDNATGNALPVGNPEHLLLEDSVRTGQLAGWNIEVAEVMETAAAVSASDTVKYAEWPTTGATSAAYVKALSSDGAKVAEGWVSCGSFMFPYQALRLDSVSSLVMPEREPRRFASEVVIYTESGKIIESTVEVNSPVEVEGWKIYQYSYDEGKGRWSDVSVFELVTDPWLPVVYAGIVMMMLGAVCMFVLAQRNNKETI